jgi:hypothetical protein
MNPFEPGMHWAPRLSHGIKTRYSSRAKPEPCPGKPGCKRRFQVRLPELFARIACQDRLNAKTR